MAYALLGLAVLDVALLIWAARHALQQPRNLALAMQAVALLLLWFDCFTVAAGAWIGAGETLEAMSRIRFVWFYLTMPLLFIGSIALLAQADFAWAKPRWLLGVAVVAALAFIAVEVPRAWSADYYTACFGDTLRYIGKVPEGQACQPGEEGLGQAAFTPVIPLVFLAVTLTGVILWVRRCWPWLAIAAIAFMAATAIPSSLVGPFLTYPLDTLMTAAFVLAALRFPPKLKAEPAP